MGNAPDFVCAADAAALARCQAHFTMWTIMKAPLLLGNDIPAESAATLAVVSNKYAIAVNQDALGVQARRGLATAPANASLTTLPGGALAELAKCDAARPSQAWTITNTSNATAPHSELFVVPCDASDAFQQWDFAGGAMRSVGAGACIDKDAPGGTDPARLAPCAAGAPGQQWAYEAASGHIRGGGGACLDVFNFQGPDVEVGSCKAPGAQDSNQVFRQLPGGLLGVASERSPPNSCLAAASAPAGLVFSTVDAAGATWCLRNAFGSEGGLVGVPCAAGGGAAGKDAPVFLVAGGAGGRFTISDPRGGALAFNNQPGASGPWPLTRYAQVDFWNPNGAPFALDLAAPAAPIRTLATGILNDDLVGGITRSDADFCLDLVGAGVLEVWVAPLTGGRFAAALFNRGPSAESIALPWGALNVSAGTSLRVFDVWADADQGTFQGSYAAVVPPSAAAYLIVAPVA